jgi:hypothetical protein
MAKCGKRGGQKPSAALRRAVTRSLLHRRLAPHTPATTRSPRPARHSTKRVPGLYVEPVSDHLQREVAALGPAAHLYSARRDEAGVPGHEAWLDYGLQLALAQVANRKEHMVAMPAF